MDALSDVLRIVRLTGGVFLYADFTDPWCIVGQMQVENLGPVLDTPSHLILYHYVVEGRLRGQIPGEPPFEAKAGDAVIFPGNHAHLLGSRLDTEPVATQDLFRRSVDQQMVTIEHGGGGEKTRLICGFLGCDSSAEAPLIKSLPKMLALDTRTTRSADWIASTFRFAADEIASGVAGTTTVLSRVSELLFVEAVRRYVEALPPDRTGWLAGLRDPHVSRALALMHGQPAAEWTVDKLGQEAGLSRSALAERFTELIGEPPMHYLARWRMQVAAHRLRTSALPLARIAQGVGYESEASFSRAFKRAFGMPPATWRKRLDEPLAQ